MNGLRFIDAVRTMRTAQKRYFMTRNKEVDLKACIAAEREVDRLLTEHDTQPSLFGGTSHDEGGTEKS